MRAVLGPRQFQETGLGVETGANPNDFLTFLLHGHGPFSRSPFAAFGCCLLLGCLMVPPINNSTNEVSMCHRLFSPCLSAGVYALQSKDSVPASNSFV